MLKTKTKALFAVVVALLVLTSRKDFADASDSLHCQRHSQSCSACVEAGSDCSWCTLPEFTGGRCDTVPSLSARGCKKPHVYEAKSDITFASTNKPLGSNKEDGSVVQLHPQNLEIRAAPGQKSVFLLTYLHVVPQPTDIYVLNSAVDALDYKISYSVECKGRIQDINVCRSVQQAETVSFNVTVEVNNCTKENRNGAYVSVGVGGVRDIVALLVLPTCGCQCEREEEQEKYSLHCGHRGDLVCGTCRCEPNFSGSKCQCHSPAGSKILEQCKPHPGAAECSGKGICECGKCQCHSPTATGSYCECDSAACPKVNGKTCNGHGNCACGACKCDPGWTGSDCACSSSTQKCLASTGEVCNKAGKCQCGICECRPGYSGPTCELTPGAVTDTAQTSPTPAAGDERSSDDVDGDVDNDGGDDNDEDSDEDEEQQQQSRKPDQAPTTEAPSAGDQENAQTEAKSGDEPSDQKSAAEPEPGAEPEPSATGSACSVVKYESLVLSLLTLVMAILCLT